jgi:coenzyme F420-reducing hydrogenase delta subunit/NAD-dependent dihydropyrimidine dehydrogenase PreA subunit
MPAFGAPNVSLHAALRGGAHSVFERSENLLDAFFGSADNPLRHLGALGLFFLWILVASGLYLYTVLDTSIEGVYSSIGWLTQEQWYLGGVLRSLHRYASDAFVIVMFLHLLREWAYGRYHGFRLYSWVTGVPLIWLVFISGIGGYWIVWDRLAQFSAVATTELLDWLPIFDGVTARNFLAPDSINDRFFTVLVFIHIGVPLMLILGLWAHVNRISRVDYLPTRRVMLATLGAFLLLAAIKPAVSDAPADLSLTVSDARLDWFILFLHPLTDLTSAGAVWTLIFGAHCPAVRPALPAAPRAPADRRGRCAELQWLQPLPCRLPLRSDRHGATSEKRAHKIAVVDADLCAACGICAGSCPSSTPFRSQQRLVTGIDMPQLPVDALRRQLEARLAELSGGTRLVVFGCDRSADAGALAAPDTATLSLICAGMLPPSFVEYALRSGADGVVVAGCRDGGCEFRLGMEWTRERLTRRREPHLRQLVPLERIEVVPVARGEGRKLAAAVAEFRNRLESQGEVANRPPAYTRRNHG